MEMTVYLIKLRIVKITVVVTVDVDVCSVGGGGSTAPGEWSIPANAETVSIRLSARIAPLLRNVFIVWSSEVIRNFCINKQTGDTKFSNQPRTEPTLKMLLAYARLAGGQLAQIVDDEDLTLQI